MGLGSLILTKKAASSIPMGFLSPLQRVRHLQGLKPAITKPRTCATESMEGPAISLVGVLSLSSYLSGLDLPIRWSDPPQNWSFCSLDVSDSGLEPTFAKIILDTLIGSSSNISALEFSDNRISGWLSPHAAAGSTPICSNLSNCLRSLQVLNLRGNGLGKEDAEDLKSTFMYMPQLKHLDISDNPLEDDGIRALVSYFTEHAEFCVDDMNMENCGISGVGVVGILNGLAVLGRPLRSFSIAHNDIGRSMAVPLSIFLSKCCVQRLNIEGTGLGPSGFNDLEEAMPSGLALEYLNISKNRGGLSTALFLSKLLVHSPELVEVDAGYNFMPLESVSIIHAALKASKGKLKRVDLTGNMHLFKSPLISVLYEFRCEGEPIVALSMSLTSMTPHDDDP